MEKILVALSKDDISNGETCSPFQCPIARAIKRKGYDNVSVGGDEVRINGIDYELPEKAQAFIYEFDGMRPVSPIRFYITRVQDEA